MPLLLLTLLACRPYADVEAREAGWYTPEGVAAHGIELTPLASGVPIGHWPRITLSMDAAGVDNRAWFLSLDDAQLADRAAAEPWLVEAPVAQSLDAGQPADTERRGLLWNRLYDAAQDVSDAGRTAAALAPDTDRPAFVTVLPDRQVPWETVVGAIFTAGQASLLGSYAIAGAHEGHVRSALAGGTGATGACRVALNLARTAEGSVLSVGTGPPVRAPGGGCHLDDDALQAAAARITETCAVHRAVRCAEVYASAEATLATGEVLTTLSTLSALHPAVEHGPLSAFVEPLAPEACALAIDLDRVDDSGWDWLCGAHREDDGPDPGKAEITSIRDLVAAPRPIHPLMDQRGLHGAFPDWAAWLDDELIRHNQRAYKMMELE